MAHAGELAKYHVRAGDIAGAIEVANHSRMISRAQFNDTAPEQASWRTVLDPARKPSWE